MTPHSLERDFYLQHFQGRSIIIAVAQEDPLGMADRVIGALGDAGAIVIGVSAADARGVTQLAAPGAGAGAGRVVVTTETVAAAGPACLRLVHGGISPEAVVTDPGLDVLDVALQIAERLKPAKLVLVAPDAPTPQTRDSAFATVTGARAQQSRLERLAGQALAAGVRSVNLCQIEGLERELLSYQGSGVLLTSQPYAEVGSVGLDDLSQVHRLVTRGMQEGFLKPRGEDEVLQLLIDGFVARVDDGHPAGFAALVSEPYTAERMAEVAALTTISRFAGGGVGSQLVRHMVDVAAARGIVRVFACTTSPEAAAFFRAVGFNDMRVEEVPEAKWAGYDPARRGSVIALGCTP